MKKVALFALIAVLSFGFAGCVTKEPEPENPPPVLDFLKNDTARVVSVLKGEIGGFDEEGKPVTLVSPVWFVVVGWRDLEATFWLKDEKQAEALTCADSVPIELVKSEEILGHIFLTYDVISPDGSRHRIDFRFKK